MHAGSKAEWHSLKQAVLHKPGPEVFFESILSPDAGNQSALSKLIAMHGQIEVLLRDTFGIGISFLEDLIRGIPVSEDNELYTKLLKIAREYNPAGSDPTGPGYRVRNHAPDPGFRDSCSLLLSIMYAPSLRCFDNLPSCLALNRAPGGIRWMNDFYLAMPGGLILGRPSDTDREVEGSLAGLAIELLGIHPDFKITSGTAEGGDILPAGDFVLIGCGPGTSIEGIMQLVASSRLSGEIAIVHEPVHPLVGSRDALISGHLDSYLNFPREGLVIGDPMLLRSAQVEVFHVESSGYSASDNPGNLLEYLWSKSIDLIELNTLEQLCNASGFLCVYDGECIAEDLNDKAHAIVKKIRASSEACGGKYSALLNRAEHDLRLMSYDGSRMMDSEYLSGFGIEFHYVSGYGSVSGNGGVRRYVGIVSRR